MHKGEQMEKHRTAAICELCNNWQPSSSYWQSVPFVFPNTMLSSQLGSTNPLKSYGTTDLGYFFHVGRKGYQANLRETLAACINSGEPKELHWSTTEKFIFLHIRLLRSSSMISENTSNLLYLTETTCKSHWLYLEKLASSERCTDSTLLARGQCSSQSLAMHPSAGNGKPSRAGCFFYPHSLFGATSDKRQGCSTSPGEPSHRKGANICRAAECCLALAWQGGAPFAGSDPLPTRQKHQLRTVSQTPP